MRNSERAMRQRRQLRAPLRKLGCVEFAANHGRAVVALRQHLPPRVDDHRVSPGSAAAVVGAALRRRADRLHRRELFKQLHRVNDALAAAHSTIIAQAHADLDCARIGVANRAITQRRDWCFALYSSHSLMELLEALHDEKAVQT